MNWGLFVAFISALIGPPPWQSIDAINLATVDIRTVAQPAWLQQRLAADPQAAAILKRYIQSLEAAGFSPDLQGVMVGVGPYAIASHQPDRRLPAASLTKMATTLAAVETYGLAHQFVTEVGWRGSLTNGVLEGDLIVKGSYDPLFVWEEGIALGNALEQLGIQHVTGKLIIVDRFVMNFETDPLLAGQLLRQSMNSDRWNREIESQYRTLGPGTGRPSLQISGGVELAPSSAIEPAVWQLRHHSLPLVAILKAMNIYSNNVMADMLTDLVGGPAGVIRSAEQAGVAPGEISLINGSGLGEDNQMSARAAVTVALALQERLRSQGLTFADIFPVVGADRGTLDDRSLPDHAALKTGSLAVVSALAGAVPTEAKGVVWFATVNYGSGLATLRRQQDRLLNELVSHWGKPAQVPAAIQPTVRFNQGSYRLGDPLRNERISTGTGD